jgi:hypothetical protein
MNHENESPQESVPDDQKSSTDGSTDTSSWNTGQEELLKAISERSNCMRWLHTQCYYYFENANFFLTIPNVILSTLNGGFTMSLTSLFPDPAGQKAATTIIGLVSIFSAMLITMNQYIKSQQMMESHRAAALSQGKLYRMISNELALRRDQRTNALEFLRVVRIEQDRLENMSPNILPMVIERFNKQFKDRDIEKPEVAGDLDEVVVNHSTKKAKGSFTPEVNPEKSPSLFARRITNKLSTVPNSVLLPSDNIHVKKIDDIP